MEISFENKNILITGAGRGVGRHLAKEFVKCKAAKVFALSRTKKFLDELVAAEPSIIPVQVDLADFEKAKKVVEKLGPIDILINNAGLMSRAPFTNATNEEIDKLFDVNFKSLFLCTQTVAKGMIGRKKGGVVINVTSGLSLIGAPGTSVYASSKGAVDSLTRTMAVELGPHQIRVNAASLGLVKTDMTADVFKNKDFLTSMISKTPLGRVCELQDISNVILFLASDKAAMLHGLILPIDGGKLICG